MKPGAFASRMAALIAAALALAAADAHAEVWGYVDGRGIAHFATSKLDSRYERLGGDVQATRVPGKTDAASGLALWLEISPQVKSVQHLLREAAGESGVDIELLKAIVAVESGFDAQARSPRGALGLMQLMPQSAQRFAPPDAASRPLAQRLLDPRINLVTGARMLRDLLDRYSLEVALAAWNAGEGTVRRYGNRLPPIPETQAHVQMVLELYWAQLQRSPRNAAGAAPAAPPGDAADTASQVASAPEAGR